DRQDPMSSTYQQVIRGALINCTVTQNYNVHSGSLQGEMLKILDTQHVIQNSIIHGNSAYNGRQVSTNLVITNSIVQGGMPTA
ncbi:MAG TPA: hypothetical protein PKN30_11695, partial [Flavobacteriales bacterium]|nr:hypothetical protein [Flavobacteriales bacterium]